MYRPVYGKFFVSQKLYLDSAEVHVQFKALYGSSQMFFEERFVIVIRAAGHVCRLRSPIK